MVEERWPSLVVFDLDFTLWDSGGTWCDCLRPPFTCCDAGNVYDANRSHVRVYPDVLTLIQELPGQGSRLGLASRTEQPGWAVQLLKLLRLHDAFPYQAIYPSDKQRHFRQLHEESGIAFEDMLFFDDEERNIRSVRKLGVHAHHVHRGVTHEGFNEALSDWRLSLT